MEKGNTVGEQEKKEIAFSNRDLRRLIVPLLIEQMLNCTVGLLDSLMVSTVGEAAVSAVSLVDCVNVLLLQVFAGAGCGRGDCGGAVHRLPGNEKSLQSRPAAAAFPGCFSHWRLWH